MCYQTPYFFIGPCRTCGDELNPILTKYMCSYVDPDASETGSDELGNVEVSAEAQCPDHDGWATDWPVLERMEFAGEGENQWEQDFLRSGEFHRETHCNNCQCVLEAWKWAVDEIEQPHPNFVVEGHPFPNIIQNGHPYIEEYYDERGEMWWVWENHIMIPRRQGTQRFPRQLEDQLYNHLCEQKRLDHRESQTDPLMNPTRVEFNLDHYPERQADLEYMDAVDIEGTMSEARDIVSAELPDLVGPSRPELAGGPAVLQGPNEA